MPGAPTYEFQTNMVFALEPLVWVPNTPSGGAVRIKDLALITEGVTRVLTRVEFEDRLLL